MQYSQKSLHPSSVIRDYNGMAVRFREVEDNVYISVTDARVLLGVGRCEESLYQTCASVAKIQFYKGKTLPINMILPFDLENLVGRKNKNITPTKQQEKIKWLRDTCKQIKNQKETLERTAQGIIKIFSHPDFGEIRSVWSEDGPLFCLVDICRSVGLLNPSQVKARLDASDTQLIDLHALNLNEGTIVGNSKATFVNESALYEVILRSDSPKTKTFRKWVTKEVLPSIRKTGAYVVATPEDTPEIIMARGLMAAKEALDRMEQRAIKAENNLTLAAPKVDYYDTVVTNREIFSTCQVASELNMSYRTLRKKLYANGITISVDGPLEVTPGHEDWGENITYRRRTGFRWNAKGRSEIFSLIDPSMPK